MTEINPALVHKIFNVPERQQEPDVHPPSQDG